MRRMTWTAALLLCFSLVLAACGTKDAESVVKELDKVVNSLESYQGSGTMTLHTSSKQKLEYKVEVSYQKPQYYRIKLTNAEKDITQIVLRNDDGVFVLTPKLNKVFRFQSDWPQNQGQVYLYQTLVQSILIDNQRQFTVDDDAYVFDVMANYSNGSLARQKIWLNKSDYKPVQVEVSDSNSTVMVEVKFDSFNFGSKFDKSVFETEANMQTKPSSQSEPPAATDQEQKDKDTVNQTPEKDSAVDGNDQAAENENEEDDAEDTTGAIDKETENKLTVMVPSHFPEGVVQKDALDIVYGGSPGIMSRYEGEDYSYTLVQTKPKDVAASLVKGLIIDLGFTMGELTGDEQKTLMWTYEGNQFRLTSANLPESEMIKIAQSVQGEIGK